MVVEGGEVRFWRAPVAVKEAFIFCLECPVVTQVGQDGSLIDIPGWQMHDLKCPPADEVYLTGWEKPDLTDRRDS